MSEDQAGQINESEKELQDIKNAMEGFFDIVPSMIAIASEDGYFKKINSAWTSVLGFSQEELLSKPFLDLIHPEDLALTLKEIKKQKDGFSSKNFINRYRCKDGSYRLLEWESTPADNGFSYATARDVTEMKQQEEVLAEREFFFRESQRIAMIGSYKIDLITGSWVSSQVLIDIFGWDANSIQSPEKWESIIHPNDAEMIHKYLRKEVLEKHKPFDKEYRIIRESDGEMRWVKGLGELTFDTEGHVVSLIGTIQDITKRKQAEELLRKEKWRLSSIIEATHVGSWELNIPTGETTFNENWAQIIGYTIAELTPMNLKDFEALIHPDDLKKTKDQMEHHLVNELPYFDSEFRMRHKDGSWVTVHDRGQVVTWTADRTPLMMFGTIANITDRKQNEAEKQRSQKLESLGILAGGVAHDFNNLLSGIFGNIELAILNTKEEKVSTFLARSLSNIDRTKALTQQLLTFAKGGAPIKKVENLFSFIQETIQFILHGSSVSALFQVEDDLWSCDCDRDQIGQVVENITLNAIQSMPNGGTIEISGYNISLSAKEHHTLVAGNYVKLSITDQGMGISKENLSKIFDPYYTTKSNGHGLGLSTCYSIINRHGGDIEVESELGLGSAFHVYIPASTESITTKVEDHTGNGTREHTGSGIFLVMDDEEIIRDYMGAILESFGYTVIVKNNGKDAVDFFIAETEENRKLAGMIFDLTIPGGMGGKEAIGEIRKICSNTPAFVASGYSEDPVIANPEEYGFNASICKPFKMIDLSEMLEKHMKK